MHFLREERPTARGRADGIGRTRLTFGLLTRQLELNRENAADERQLEEIVSEQNERTQKLNGQIIDVLATLSGIDPVPDVKNWWQWWETQTDTERPGTKPTVVNVDESEAGNPSTRFYRTSCFAAGTLIWTDHGPVPIEQISVGDRVLAKDIETGELAMKPVLKTTVRPPKELTTLRFGDETIVCTGGHRFWSSGSGWIKARDLTEQTLLHTVTGNTPVWTAKKGQTAETYNLVVADFHTYFVGETGVLVQDLLPPQRTNNIVPGLARANAGAGSKK